MKYIFLLLGLSFPYCSSIVAQTKPAVIKKSALPKLTTSLSGYKDSVGLTQEQVAAIIDKALVVTDDKKSVYKVSSYQFVYKRRGVSETEDGKAIPATSVNSQLFTVSPLQPIWVKTIREQMRKGEELWFLSVVVKDAAGKVMYAPPLKITVL